ncbi:uncharacterized protein LOC131440079 [Malaya genurostris]|uniref:uncharacterized protein LOC131440079 n=1 Tax=Malaya genurostris TaxID=325434 RepID=UPI0026F392AF|nr:uncharacterized protein LOC131440079 [Malaya genurostris]
MAAASSGDPGGSYGRRLPTFMDPTNKFGELTFLQLKGKNDIPLPRNPFIIGKSVENAAGGPIEDANTEAQGTRYTLRVRDPSQVTKLLKMTQLIDGTEVVIEAHPNLNVSRCVITCYDLIQMEEKDVLAEILSQGVIRVQRITRSEGGNRVNTPALILTFCKTTYPKHIKIGLLHISTRPYFPNPMLCYNCFNFGHTRMRCPSPKRCFNCSGEQHGEEECNEAQFCRNCKGDHRPSNRQCPVYKKEVEIIKIKVRENITFPEARKRAEQQTQGSYAQATAQQTRIEKKLKEMELTMKQKDEQIVKLLEAAKRKEEKMEQMMAYIQQLKHQIATQDKSFHSKEQNITPTILGPVTRSRNNSPAIQETKRGRPPKQNMNITKKPQTYTDSQSPPPKKTATITLDTSEPMTYSDEEIEISETPPSQLIR